jgi:hypothetical protein
VKYSLLKFIYLEVFLGAKMEIQGEKGGKECWKRKFPDW